MTDFRSLKAKRNAEAVMRKLRAQAEVKAGKASGPEYDKALHDLVSERSKYTKLSETPEAPERANAEAPEAE